jgi:hypothetical protein
MRQQDGPLAEVQGLLATLGQAWEEARTREKAPVAAAVPPAAATVPPAPAWQNSSLEPVAQGWSA